VIAAIRERAHDHVKQRLGSAIQDHAPDWGAFSYWSSWPMPPGYPESAVFQTALTEADPPIRRAVGEGWLFGVGVTFKTRDNPARYPENEQWLAERRGQRFFESPNPGYPEWFIWRYLEPSKLLEGTTTLDGQAKVLSDWILE